VLDDIHHEDLERYLRSAPIVQVMGFEHGGAHGNKRRLTLEGGVTVMAKPATGIADGMTLIRREVAAWTIARELGWGDLVPATVLRAADLEDGAGNVQCSLQILMPDDYIFCSPVDGLEEHDTMRAAIFDMIIHHTDRQQNNWAALPSTAPWRLRLFDHGHTFDVAGGQLGSSFYEKHKDEAISSEHLAALSRLDHPRQSKQLQELLSSQALGQMADRVNKLKAGLVQL
jgi:hypothetical protein